MLAVPREQDKDKTKKKTKRKENKKMTVCIAALCEMDTVIVGVADRMITSGQIIEYQPPQLKFIIISPIIFLMIAGDISLHSEILPELMDRIKDELEEPFLVKDIAMMYHELTNEIYSKKKTDAILNPFGLTSETFISRQNEMAEHFINSLTNQIANIGIPEVSTIIAGIDEKGAHIYVEDEGSLRCETLSGFAAIGMGSWHAESELMNVLQARDNNSETTVFNCYSAKKRAEIASGVGDITDIICVQTNKHTILPQSLIKHLDNFYNQMRKGENEAKSNALNKWNEEIRQVDADEKKKKKENQNKKAKTKP